MCSVVFASPITMAAVSLTWTSLRNDRKCDANWSIPYDAKSLTRGGGGGGGGRGYGGDRGRGGNDFQRQDRSFDRSRSPGRDQRRQDYGRGDRYNDAPVKFERERGGDRYSDRHGDRRRDGDRRYDDRSAPSRDPYGRGNDSRDPYGRGGGSRDPYGRSGASRDPYGRNSSNADSYSGTMHYRSYTLADETAQPARAVKEYDPTAALGESSTNPDELLLGASAGRSSSWDALAEDVQRNSSRLRYLARAEPFLAEWTGILRVQDISCPVAVSLSAVSKDDIKPEL